MSRILRRPMFRGGRVSSYGTGIASGMANGGMPPRRGLVIAPGGYAGDEGKLGGEILSENVVDFSSMDFTPKKTQDYYLKEEEYKDYVPELQTPEDFEKAYEKKLDALGSAVEGYEIESWGMTRDREGLPLTGLHKEYDFLQTADGKATFMKKLKDEQDAKIKEVNKYRDEKEKAINPVRGTDKVTVDSRDVELAKMQQTIEQLLKDKNTEASTEIDKDEIFKMLGGDKARGRDITNMLLGFAGAQGDDTMSKFQNFAAAEAKRPGEQARLKETAGMLAVKDKLDTRKSDRNIAQILGLESKKIGMKSAAEHLSNLDWQTRKLTIAKSMGNQSPTSAGVIRQTLMYEPSEQGKTVTVTNDTKVVTEPDKFDVGLYVLDAGDKGKQVIEIIDVNGIKEAKPRNEYII